MIITSTAKIFIVDDMPANIGVLNNFLNSKGFTVLIAQDGQSALSKIERAQPDLILLDVMMDGMDGYETCRRLKANSATVDIPVIFTTALSDTLDKIQGLELGAVDYITKPFQQEEVLARINVHLNLRLLQKQLESKNAQLTRALRLKDEFLANISHELRTPLNAMLGAAEILHEQIYGNLNDKQVYHLAMIENSGQHLLEIISDLLDLAQLEAERLNLDLSSIGLQDLAEELLAEFLPQAEKKQQSLLYIFDASCFSIYGDFNRIKQILSNLLNNAIKFTQKEGHIQLEISDAEQPEFLCISIRDNGPGIPPDQVASLFEAFVQLDGSLSRLYEGTGLGLPLVEKLTRLHGGWINVETEEGKGACFKVFLPIYNLRFAKMNMLGKKNEQQML